MSLQRFAVWLVLLSCAAMALVTPCQALKLATCSRRPLSECLNPREQSEATRRFGQQGTRIRTLQDMVTTVKATIDALRAFL